MNLLKQVGDWMGYGINSCQSEICLTSTTPAVFVCCMLATTQPRYFRVIQTR